MSKPETLLEVLDRVHWWSKGDWSVERDRIREALLAAKEINEGFRRGMVVVVDNKGCEELWDAFSRFDRAWRGE